MTCDPIWTVWCDAGGSGVPGCHHWCEDTAMTKRDARANARAAGWKRTDGRDACPGCQRAGRT